MLERQYCNTVFLQNKCPDAYFKFQLKGLEYIIEGGWVVILLQIIMVVILWKIVSPSPKPLSHCSVSSKILAC